MDTLVQASAITNADDDAPFHLSDTNQSGREIGSVLIDHCFADFTEMAFIHSDET
jgi:hypothetical protein